MHKLHSFSTGRSGCPVSLIYYNGIKAIHKERLRNVSGILDIYNNINLPTPKIYEYSTSTITMEYIDGINMHQYLRNAGKEEIMNLVDYISSYFDQAAAQSSLIECDEFIEQKIKVLSAYGVDLKVSNTKLLCGMAHGDFTFDNILFKDGIFYMIDLTPSVYSGIHFDANKLRQDLTGHWFIRNEKDTSKIKKACEIIYNELNARYSFLFDDELYKFMFARVLPYCTDDTETSFIKHAIS